MEVGTAARALRLQNLTAVRCAEANSVLAP